jgi:MFS family permease
MMESSAPVARVAPAPALDPRRWWALALVVTAQFMVILDATIVNVALPSIQRDLGFAQENLQWVISAYAIMFGGTLLLGGRLADLLGRRRLLLVGLALFSFSSLLFGLAWSEASLIAFRAAQGLGAALLAPAALALLLSTFAEGRQRNLALGGAIGLAAISAVAAASTSSYVDSHREAQASSAIALTHGFQTGLYVLSGLLLFGALIAATLVKPRPRSLEAERAREQQPEPVREAA